ncbi:hypothetical protein HGM15179_013188 [Zosterops borbonicus]|uniref:Uncharacterized protein n=1 Tax=Zosterops borbonicus TaxID=364589 RepID=A0A8K1G8U5_9PASS|nr:hypothetical protein HGM15179_013188 [Zosterops borbonicus]
MVSVGGTAATTHQEKEKKKDYTKSLTLIDISNQYYCIYGIIIYYFGLYLLASSDSYILVPVAGRKLSTHPEEKFQHWSQTYDDLVLAVPLAEILSNQTDQS